MTGKLRDEARGGEPRRRHSSSVNHYCTFFDQRYAAQGIALWLSLRRHDPTAVLWVLALDGATMAAVRALGEADLRGVPLAELEAADPALLTAKANRAPVEYVFTLSPCLPLFLLKRHPEIAVVTYLDADLAFFSSPAPIFAELGKSSILIVGHRFPDFLSHLETCGRFNVGVLCFRHDALGRACLEDWRAQCLEWCYDRVEPGRFADQKYLDAWPGKFPGVVVCTHPGVNLAPWNWMNHRYAFAPDGLRVDGAPLVVFHFSRFKVLGPARLDSGQIEYGVMPLRLRTWIYGRYWTLLEAARARLMPVAPELAWPVRAVRGHRAAWKTRSLELLFGPVWWRVGPWWISGRLGFGQFSGRMVNWVRRRFGQRREAGK
jgi:hypothetical protein